MGKGEREEGRGRGTGAQGIHQETELPVQGLAIVPHRPEFEDLAVILQEFLALDLFLLEGGIASESA